MGSDLDFNGHTVHALQHGVQRLVTVCLGNGDVVLEFPGYRLIEAVHHSQRAIAIIDGIDNHTKSKDIHHLGEGFSLGLHLIVNTVEVLFPSHDNRIEPFAVQGLAQLVANLVNELLAVTAR